MYTPYNFCIPEDWLKHIETSIHPDSLFVEGHMPQETNVKIDGESQAQMREEQSVDSHAKESLHEDDEFDAPLDRIQGNLDTMLTEQIPVNLYNDRDALPNEFGQNEPTKTSDTLQILTVAPGEGQIPVFKKGEAEHLSFPTIWCGQEHPTNKECHWKVHTSDIFKAELKNVDPHVCLNVPNIFWKAKHLQVVQVASNKGTIHLLENCRTSSIEWSFRNEEAPTFMVSFGLLMHHSLVEIVMKMFVNILTTVFHVQVMFLQTRSLS